jgi:hypothetical protein
VCVGYFENGVSRDSAENPNKILLIHIEKRYTFKQILFSQFNLVFGCVQAPATESMPHGLQQQNETTCFLKNLESLAAIDPLPSLHFSPP